jgi:hypothetical protein
MFGSDANEERFCARKHADDCSAGWRRSFSGFGLPKFVRSFRRAPGGFIEDAIDRNVIGESPSPQRGRDLTLANSQRGDRHQDERDTQNGE